MKKLALALAPLMLLAVACGGNEKKPVQTPPSPPPAVTPSTTQTTSADPNKMAVNVDQDIIKLCNLKFENVEDAPKFDYDNDSLTPGERNVLEAVAKCLTTGPLKGKAVDLVGRADPRGESEYNMTLGARRARSVHTFLGGLGVGNEKMHDTSRGEMDATGKDETGWRLDRRVDVRLTKTDK